MCLCLQLIIANKQSQQRYDTLCAMFGVRVFEVSFFAQIDRQMTRPTAVIMLNGMATTWTCHSLLFPDPWARTKRNVTLANYFWQNCESIMSTSMNISMFGGDSCHTIPAKREGGRQQQQQKKSEEETDDYSTITASTAASSTHFRNTS